MLKEAPAENHPVLVVDLDGTLLRSDMLFETFWSALSRDWKVPFHCVRTLKQGKAALKRDLAGRSDVDVATLPYDPEVIAYVTAWRDRGGRTALVTATDAALADRIAGHLGIFDDVHGSDGTRNNKGPAKAALLSDLYGDTGYAYMGDHEADLEVWKDAARAITVNAPPALRKRAEALDTEVEHLSTVPASVKPYLKALRPHQWLKNVLVFLPLMAAHQFGAATLLQAVLAFVCFSMVASSVYVLNDLLDLAADRVHPRKRNRPFAAGAVPIAHGTWMAAGLLGAGTLIAATLGGPFLLVMAVYYVVTTAYSLYLKRQIIIDICVLAGLYTMRIVAGGTATGIPLSVWLLAFSIFFFFALAAVKRQAELVDSLERGKLDASGRGYRVSDLPLIGTIGIAAGYVSVLVMALYLNSPAVRQLYSYPQALWGICLVLLYWLTRMVMVTHRGQMHDDPVVYAARDRISQICGLIIFAFALGGALL